jgi:hypothetical protein
MSVSLTEGSMNAELFVLLNGVGTANYDPCPLVENFSQKRETGGRELDITVYKERYFIKKCVH